MNQQQFSLAQDHIRTVANTIGFYVGAIVAFVVLTIALVNSGRVWSVPFSFGALVWFTVSLTLYVYNTWQLLPHIDVPESGQTSRQTKQDEPRDAIEENATRPPLVAQRPSQPPVREERTVEFVTVDSGARIVDGWMYFGNRNVPLPTHIKPEWLTAVRKAQLSHVSGNLLHQAGVSRFEQADNEGNTPAALLIDFLRERGLIERDGQVWRFTDDGRKAFPSPTHTMH